METLIEIYDNSPIFNVYAAAVLKPKRVVFIGGRRMTRDTVKNRLSGFFAAIGLDIEIEYCSVMLSDFDAVVNRLRKLIKKYPDCAIDLTGGTETVIAAAGLLSCELGAKLFCENPRDLSFINVHNCPELDNYSADINLSIGQVIKMAGGLVTGHGHISNETITPEFESDILLVWKTVKRYRKLWSEQTAFFQRAAKQRSETSYGEYEQSEKHLYVDNVPINSGRSSNSTCSLNIMRSLEKDRIIEKLRVSGDRVSFKYKNSMIKKCLSDAGIWLEMYGFVTARKTGIFSDAQLSVTIDWNGDLTERFNTYNEIDIMLTHGIVPIFISCKMSAPSVAAINEIRTLTDRFGGQKAKAVILTMADMPKDAPYALQRAFDCGVKIIDRNTISHDKLGNALTKLVGKQNRI